MSKLEKLFRIVSGSDQLWIDNINTKEKERTPEGDLAEVTRKTLNKLDIDYTSFRLCGLGEFVYVQSNYEKCVGVNRDDWVFPLLMKELPSYGWLINKEGKILTEVSKVDKNNSFTCAKCLDKNNVVIPVMIEGSENWPWNKRKNKTMHYKIENDEAHLINSFYGSFKEVDKRLALEKVAVVGLEIDKNEKNKNQNYLYSFGSGEILSDGYSSIDYDSRFMISLLDKKLDDSLTNIMMENNWLLVTKEVYSGVVDDSFFGFIGMDGLPTTDLFYINDENDIIKCPIKKTVEASAGAGEEMKKIVDDRVKDKMDLKKKYKDKREEIPELIKRVVLGNI